jgi:predicted metal-dependent phosphoesterase TrpH
MELVTAYRSADYDFVAITDHDYVTPDPKVEGMLFITGNEVTST